VSERSRITPGMALFPLRLFLGVTFTYAGIQKLTDPGFFHAGAPTYIGTQLEGFAAGTPGGFILRTFALPHPELAGAGVAVLEIMIGLLVTAGLFTRVASIAGLGLNFLLFLTASWHTTPYFLGPDLVFSFAWLPFALAGAAGQPALDNLLREPSPALRRRTRLRPEPAGAQPTYYAADDARTRRVVLAEFGAMALAIAGISALVKGPYAPAKSLASPSSGGGSVGVEGGGGAGGATAGAEGASGGGGGGGSQQLPQGAVRLGPAKRLGDGQAATYSDPSDGSPDILIRDSEGNLRAFSAVCTHAGCTVAYEGGVIYCPCHGGEYSAETGEVIAGPPPSGLAPRRVVESGGQIYAVPS
jgi:thiosulfate dehydrogenase [quinone] large subunit